MHDDNNNKPPFPGQGQPPQNRPQNGAANFGQIDFRSPENAAHPQPQPAAPVDVSENFEFSSTHSGFQTNATGFSVVPEEPTIKITTKVRAVYGASAFFGAAIIGLFLGFLNSALQGADMLGELGTVIEITLWFAAFVGLLGALKPREFERIFENLRSKLDD